MSNSIQKSDSPIWELSWYDKNSETIVSYERFTGLNTKECLRLFNLVEKAHLLYEIPVGESHLLTLQRYVQHSINLKIYDYFFRAIQF